MFRFLSASLFASFFWLGSVLAGTYLSPVAIAIQKGSKRAWVAAHTGRRLLRVSLADGKTDKTIELPFKPSGLALATDGKALYVTGGVADGRLLVVDTEEGATQKILSLGHTPVAPRLAPDGRTLYVCNRHLNEICVVDTEAFEVVERIQVVREPFACDLTPDGKYLYVANHIPAGRADLEYVACKVSVIDTGTRKVIAHIPLVNGAEGMRGIRVSPDGTYVYATHLMARFLVPTTQIERGWINTNALSAIRVADQKLLYTILLDDVDKGFANPWGIEISPDGSLLCVAAAGTHELSLIDLKPLTAKIEGAAAKMGDTLGKVHLTVQNDLSFLSGLRRRVALKGNGPRAIAMDGGCIYATEYFTDSLGRVEIKDGAATKVESIPLGPTVPLTPERKGEMFFNDASLCFQHWQSCASCHPDARTDALNWDLLNDGMGNPKNVKSLVLSHATPPVMALGVRAKAEVAVRAGIRYIQFAVRPEEDAAAIDAYLKAIQPEPSPFLVDGTLSPSAERGKAVFERAGCGRCHPAPLYTDLNKYDVGTGKGQDKGKAFDTPTLCELWRTAPYMHDGRSPALRDVITVHNPADARGKTSILSEKEITDLVEYIQSL